MARWLLKSEPDVFGYDDLVRNKRAGWDGIRNYMARNYMRAMRKGDLAIFYHSNAKPPGVAAAGRRARRSTAARVLRSDACGRVAALGRDHHRSRGRGQASAHPFLRRAHARNAHAHDGNVDRVFGISIGCDAPSRSRRAS